MDIIELIESKEFKQMIGIEIEFHLNTLEVLNVIKRNIPRLWKLEVEDLEKNIFEIVSPPLDLDNPHDYGQIISIFSLLSVLEKSKLISYNSNCGIHVHYDCYDMDLDSIKNVIENFSQNESKLLEIINPERKNNQWCLPLRKNISIDNCESVREIAEKLQYNGKCHSLNIYAYEKFKTLEVRLLEATSNINKLMSWINTLDKLVFNYGI